MASWQCYHTVRPVKDYFVWAVVSKIRNIFCTLEYIILRRNFKAGVSVVRTALGVRRYNTYVVPLLMKLMPLS